MPSAYLNGIASTQASTKDEKNPYSGANASSLYNPNTPWNAPTFVSGSRAGGPGNMQDQKEGAVDWNGGSNNGIYWSDTGPGGAGYYQTNNPGQNALAKQQYFTNQFNENIPQMANDLYSQAGSQLSTKMNQGIRSVKQSNSGRGLLYGGINQGQEHGVRANAAGEMASAKSNINQGLISAGQSMQSNTVQSGVSYQQMQQALNNAIYENAMSKLNGDTAMTNSLIGSAATIGGYAAFAK